MVISDSHFCWTITELKPTKYLVFFDLLLPYLAWYSNYTNASVQTKAFCQLKLKDIGAMRLL